MAEWIGLAQAMLTELRVGDFTLASFEHSLSAPALAVLLQAESRRVDHALIGMALAGTREEAQRAFRELKGDTLIAMNARWLHYLTLWKKMHNQPAGRRHWFPRDRSTWWRAILLAMTVEDEYSGRAIEHLWPVPSSQDLKSTLR